MWLRHGHVVFKWSIFEVQKATAPKNGVEFCQCSIGTIRSSLATLHGVWRRRQFSTNQRPRNYLTLTNSQTHKLTHTESTYCQALLYDQRLQKLQRLFQGPFKTVSKTFFGGLIHVESVFQENFKQSFMGVSKMFNEVLFCTFVLHWTHLSYLSRRRIAFDFLSFLQKFQWTFSG